MKYLSTLKYRLIPPLLLWSLGGCASTPPPAPLEVIEEGFETEAVLPLRTEKARPRVAPRRQKETEAVEERRFQISANGIAAREFFLGLVEFSEYNIAVHPEVEGEVTVSLKNVTVPEVMEVMRNVFGYEYRRAGGSYQVLPGGLQSRIYQVDYLNLSREGTSKTRISSGQVTQVGGLGGEESVSGSQIDTQTYSDFWKELDVALWAIVGDGEGRSVVTHPQAGVVVVRAPPREQAEVGKYLSIVQGNLQRQVVIEAKIIEVALSDGFRSGINWASLTKLGNGQGLTLGQTGGGTLLPSGISELAGEEGSLTPDDPSVSDPSIPISAFGGAFAAALQLNNFSTFIELLESQGDVQVLSSPRISTVNNQKAVIKVGNDEYFVTDVSSDTVTGTTSSSSTDITLTPFFSGIALDVTPQIDANGFVTLHIHPTVSEVVDQQKVISVGEKPQVLPLAFSSVRESDSIIRAASGQVVVIGGLMKNGKTEDVAAVPLLGDLPLVGPMFRHTGTTSLKSELVILLRPVVVESGKGWDRLRENTRRRFETYGAAENAGWSGEFSVEPSQ